MPAFPAYWQALFSSLNDLEIVVLTGGSTLTAVSTTLYNPTVGTTAEQYIGRWLYHYAGANAPQQRKVTNYDPVTGSTGTLSFAPAAQALAATDAIALTSLFPVVSQVGSDTDARSIINRALGRMARETEVAVPITTGTSFPLTSYPWLDRPKRLLYVREPHPVAGQRPIEVPIRGWELIPGIPAASLGTHRAFLQAVGELRVGAIRPMDTYIKVAGTWGESQSGLVGETDEAQPSVEEFLPFGLVEALTVLIARSPGRPNAEWQALLQAAEADVARSAYRDRTQEADVPGPAPSTAGAAGAVA